MPRSLKGLVLFLAGLAIATLRPPASLAQDATAPRRVAFLVGVNVYDKRSFPDLQWAENDVDEMAVELRRLGYDKVVVMKGSSQGKLRASKENIEPQLEAFLEDVRKTDIVLIMFTGHGQQLLVKGVGDAVLEDNFFCPVNARVNQAATMVSLTKLTDETLKHGGGKNLVLIDACRDARVIDLDKGVARGVQGKVVSLPEGTAMLFSCAAGQISLEKSSLKHGVFTSAVLEALRGVEPGRDLTWISLVGHVQDRVPALNPTQEPTASQNIGRVVLGGIRGTDVITSRSTGIKLKLIPAGTFQMGSSKEEDKDADDDELPRHEVRISRAFYLAATEVTQGQYRAITGESPSQFEGSDDLPVERVSWFDAVRFCNALSVKEGLPAFYRIVGETVSVSDWRDTGYRLPTEAEWEYACRGRNPARYSFGDDAADLGEYAWYDGNSENKTHPVGQKRGNAFGLYDMHGNVYEWCWDGYDAEYYGQSPGTDPSGPLQATFRMYRGGSCSFVPRSPRSPDRFWLTPDDRSDYLGFRVARVQSGG
ncbi:SUMF1/EgtB/PvdO family nonheme iron enzyme [Singulisphaera sp. Ch08]|uniref:SUMF1/EgtB/PvdO family nonheme iron enzyme n=1 Tax=Singulisphaera sp. Ch08 TaxID=3120278 RepID=A0AAU7CB94_9BACT